MKIKIGFGYEQNDPGMFLYDAETGNVVLSEYTGDGIGTDEIRQLLKDVEIEIHPTNISNG